MYNFYAVGKDTLAMKAVVGEDALTVDDKNFLLFLEKFETQFLQQGKYEKRDIFRSLEGAWDLLRLFERKSLSKINDEMLNKYYLRKGAVQREGVDGVEFQWYNFISQSNYSNYSPHKYSNWSTFFHHSADPVLIYDHFIFILKDLR